MKKLGLIIPAFLAAAALLMPCSAGATSVNGVLTVTATVVPSMQILFNNSGTFVLTGSGTNAATAALGSINAYGTFTGNTGVTRTVVGATSFTVSAPFGLEVDLANTPSEPTPTYTLTAALGTTDGNTWAVGPTGSPVTITTTATSITSTGANGNTAYALNLTVPFTQKGASLAVSNTITFNATAN
jgi:hypothetical protein